MASSFVESLASTTMKYLKTQYPNKQLISDRNLQESRSQICGIGGIKILTREIGSNIHFKTSIKSINQYLQ